jgi:hypothetical protein
MVNNLNYNICELPKRSVGLGKANGAISVHSVTIIYEVIITKHGHFDPDLWTIL